MIKINPAFVIKSIASLQVLIDKATQLPVPEEISTRITSPEENKTEYHIVVLNAAFKTKSDAEKFLEFDERLDNVFGMR
ncbi:MAG TPA: hypothetical protein VLD38_04345 [Nitrosopumilaceae archaeon]|nr:hypothetical protein [Nitrosopumilaceae archaeon]